MLKLFQNVLRLLWKLSITPVTLFTPTVVLFEDLGPLCCRASLSCCCKRGANCTFPHRGLVCLKCTYFAFQGQHYQQIHGAAMGSPVSPIVCNLYMEAFEQRALATAPHPPRFWKRYADDTGNILKCEYPEEFTESLNSIDPENIHWTSEGEGTNVIPTSNLGEIETERNLAFLDTETVIQEDNSIKTREYRKKTHTNRYLNFNSDHPLDHKKSVARTLLRWTH